MNSWKCDGHFGSFGAFVAFRVFAGDAQVGLFFGVDGEHAKNHGHFAFGIKYCCTLSDVLALVFEVWSGSAHNATKNNHGVECAAFSEARSGKHQLEGVGHVHHGDVVVGIAFVVEHSHSAVAECF